MTARTTFFALRAAGPYVMVADAGEALLDRAEFERRRELRWLPPIPVAVEDLDALPAVVRTVR
jgi:hypothetical protein